MLVNNASILLKVLLYLGLAVSTVSHAALFDDTEARKRILEVEAKTASDHEAQQNAINELVKTQKSLEKRTQTLESLINSKGLLDMQNQVEQLKQDIAQLKGDVELALHRLDEIQRKQNEGYVDLDTRLRRLETGAVATVSSTSTSVDSGVTSADGRSAEAKTTDASQADARALAEADALNQTAKYKEAFNAYESFLKIYVGSKLMPEALYGMGNAQFGLKNYKSAIATQQKFLDTYPAHALAPNALLNVANCQIQLGQVPAAKKTLKDLIAQFPVAEITPTAQKRLKLLESIK